MTFLLLEREFDPSFSRVVADRERELRLMDPEYARGIASGDIDPLTKLPIFDSNPDSCSALPVCLILFSNVRGLT